MLHKQEIVQASLSLSLYRAICGRENADKSITKIQQCTYISLIEHKKAYFAKTKASEVPAVRMRMVFYSK